MKHLTTSGDSGIGIGMEQEKLNINVSGIVLLYDKRIYSSYLQFHGEENIFIYWLIYVVK